MACPELLERIIWFTPNRGTRHPATPFDTGMPKGAFALRGPA